MSAAYRRARWLLLAVTVLFAFSGLSGGAGFEPIDGWVAQTAREMLAAGEWLVPRFSGEARMQKSPGPYWAVMLVSRIRGGVVDEVSARLPNALAAVVLVMTIAWLTRRIAGERAALFGGFATAGSVLVLWWSHRAASDLGLTTCTTVAVAAVWVACEAEPPGRRRIALLLLGYFAAGVGMLWKMPMPLVVVGLPLAAYVLLRRRWAALWSGWHLVGLGLFLLPWLPWALGVLAVEERAILRWKVEFFDRFTGALPNVEGQSSWRHLWTYLGPMAFYTLPFTLSLPGAFYRVFRPPAGARRDGLQFMLIWFVSLLVFFTASAGKEWRYLLPALPPLFVLLGVELSLFFSPSRRAAPRRERAVAMALWIGVPVALGAGVLGLHRWYRVRGVAELAGSHTWSDVWISYAVTGAILAAGVGLAALFYVRRREQLSFATLVLMMGVAWLWIWPRLLPLVASQRPFAAFAAELNDPTVLPPELRGSVRFMGMPEPRLIWYGDLRIPRVIEPLRLLEEQGGRRTLAYEMRRTGEEVVHRLRGPEPALFVAGLAEFILFTTDAPPELAKAGQPLPPLHLWAQSRYGREDQQFVLFANRPSPRPEAELALRPELRAKRLAKGMVLPPWPPAATQPAATHHAATAPATRGPAP